MNVCLFKAILKNMPETQNYSKRGLSEVFEAWKYFWNNYIVFQVTTWMGFDMQVWSDYSAVTSY